MMPAQVDPDEDKTLSPEIEPDDANDPEPPVVGVPVEDDDADDQ